jgi:hypothetical protein
VRREDWDSRLAGVIDAWAKEPFEWGVHDCALWAAAAVEAQTGKDFAAPFRGKYTSQKGAAVALRKYGAGTLEATMTKFLDEPIPVAFAKRGDIVMRDGNVGVCVGYYALFVGDEGLEQIAAMACQKAWAVNG